MNKNKTTAIIGASRGIGVSLAKKLALEKHRLILFDVIEPEKADLTEILAFSPESQYIKLNVKNISSLPEIFNSAFNRELNHLVYLVRAKVKSKLPDVTPAEWDEDMDLNLKGAFFSVQTALPHFKNTNEDCSITFISSVSANFIGAESVSYHVSKAGLNHLAKYLAVHLGPQKIRVNAVQPGLIVQDRHRKRFDEESNINYKRVAESCQPLCRSGNDSDVIDPLLFLLSNDSRYITGHVLTIDGGLTLQDPYFLLNEIDKRNTPQR